MFKYKLLRSTVFCESSEICGGKDLRNRVICHAFGIKMAEVQFGQRQ